MAKSKMINETHDLGEGETEGLRTTLTAYDEFDMNILNDPTGKHPEWQEGGSLAGKKKK